MPIVTELPDLSDRLIVSTPTLSNHGYRVIEWLHRSEETCNMTNAEWIAILSTAIFCLGFDIAAKERKTMHYDVMEKLGRADFADVVDKLDKAADKLDKNEKKGQKRIIEGRNK